jgi:hypothetical protein
VKSLSFSGLFLAISIGSLIGTFVPIIFYIALFSGAIITSIYLGGAIFSAQRITPYSALAINFSLGYLVGPAVAVLYFLLPHAIPPNLLVGPFAFYGNVDWFSKSIAYAALVVSVLIIIGEFSSNKLLIYKTFAGSKIHDYIFMAVITTLTTIALVFGDIGYMGVQNIGNTSHITIIGGLAGTIITALPSIFIVEMLRHDIGRRSKILYLVMTFAAFIAIIIIGRRNLIYSVLSAVIIAFLYRPDIGKSFRTRLLTKVAAIRMVFAILLVVTILTGFSYFYAVRIAETVYGSDQATSTLLLNGLDIWNSSVYSEYHATAEAKARSGTLPGYLGALMASNIVHLDGTCMLHAVINSTPRLILPNKTHLLDEYSSCFDMKVNARAGLPAIDSPISIITQAYVDFGYFAPFVYVILIGALFSIVPPLIRLNGSAVFSIFATSVLLNVLLPAEHGLSFYIFSVRNLLIIFIFSYSLRLLLKINIKISHPICNGS